jgi:hypothetical protein
MDMQMENRLAGFRVRVDNRSKTGAVDPPLLRHAPRDGQKVTEQRLVIVQIFVQGTDMFARDDQQMNRGFGMNILEDQTLTVLVQDLGRFFVRGHLAENTSEHFHPPSPISVEKQLLEPKGKHIHS